MSQFKQQNFLILIVLSILIGVISRLLPHPANITAVTSLGIIIGNQLSKKIACLVILTTLLISDILLSYYNSYPIFGTWTVFTYTGYLLIGILANNLPNSGKLSRYLCYTILAACGFWLWTNFGVWLSSGLYPKTTIGLLECYVAALPFLRNGLIGDIGWIIILLKLLQLNKSLVKKITI